MPSQEPILAELEASMRGDWEKFQSSLVAYLTAARQEQFDHIPGIISNASKISGEIYDFLHTIKPKAIGGKTQQRAHYQSLRKAVTLRDSLDQVAKMLRGEDLDPPSKREDLLFPGDLEGK